MRVCRFLSSGKIGRKEQPCLWSSVSTLGWKPCLSTVFFLTLFPPPPLSLSLSLSLSLWLFLSFSRALNNGSGRMNCFRRKAISVNTTWARTVECLPDLIFGGTTVITSISSCYTTCVLARRCARLMSWSKEISKWNFYAGSIAFLQLGSSAYSYPFYFFRSNVRDILKQVQQSPTVVVIFCKFPQRSF